MRGLKPISTPSDLFVILSHLLQMRGLKLQSFVVVSNEAYVASFTDAWIETLTPLDLLYANWVASFTDAWIETCRHVR